MKTQSAKPLQERFFYHSFPRRKNSESDDEIEKGLAILRSIVKSGLLLVPEITEWSEPLSDGTMSKAVQNIQKRACFTELSQLELKHHAMKFGNFSLEFDIPTLRQLGAIPVFYFPRASESDAGLESLAASLLVRVREIQLLLDRLSDLEKLVSEEPNKNKSLLLNKNDRIIGNTRSSIGGAEDIISFLSYGAQPVNILRNALRYLSGFFYPAEDLKYTDILDYYRQREWRIIANMSKLGKELTRDLTPEEEDEIKAIDNEFWDQMLKFHTGKYSRISECSLFSELDGKKIIQYAHRIVVPPDAQKEAQKILNEAIVDIPVVTIDSIPYKPG